jgi:hypothetical protein
MQTQLEARPTRDEAAPIHPRAESRYLFVGLSIAAIWLASLAAILWSPDLISGSMHEHIAIAALTDWFYAAIATGLVLMAFGRRSRGATRSLWMGFTVAIAAIWFAVAIASIYAPSFVTGTDPTTVPIAVFVAPIAGTIATAFASVFAAGSAGREEELR